MWLIREQDHDLEYGMDAIERDQQITVPAASSCGCGCCGDTSEVKARDEEIEELLSLREATLRRLTELGAE